MVLSTKGAPDPETEHHEVGRVVGNVDDEPFGPRGRFDITRCLVGFNRRKFQIGDIVGQLVVLTMHLRSTEADENDSSGRARRPVQHWNLFRGSVWPRGCVEEPIIGHEALPSRGT